MVEDNEINRAALGVILAPEYMVLEAENGGRALEVLEKYRKGISLILLDILIPVMDGYTFLQRVKGDHLIIHFASLLRAHTRADDVLVRMGGDEFLVVIRRVYSLIDAVKKGSAICEAFCRSRYAKLDTAACSAGVTLCHAKESINEIIRRADTALYTAKDGGKGGYLSWKEN